MSRWVQRMAYESHQVCCSSFFCPALEYLEWQYCMFVLPFGDIQMRMFPLCTGMPSFDTCLPSVYINNRLVMPVVEAPINGPRLDLCNMFRETIHDMVVLPLLWINKVLLVNSWRTPPVQTGAKRSLPIRGSAVVYFVAKFGRLIRSQVAMFSAGCLPVVCNKRPRQEQPCHL